MTAPIAPKGGSSLDFVASSFNKYVTSEVVVTGTHVVRSMLLEYGAAREAQSAIGTPLSLFVTLLASVLITKEFRSILGLASQWVEILMILFTVASGVWTLIAMKGARSKREDANIDRLLGRLRR